MRRKGQGRGSEVVISGIGCTADLWEQGQGTWQNSLPEFTTGSAPSRSRFGKRLSL